MINCGNCNNEATHFYLTSDCIDFYLCTTCAEAFELGQINADNPGPHLIGDQWASPDEDDE